MTGDETRRRFASVGARRAATTFAGLVLAVGVGITTDREPAAGAMATPQAATAVMDRIETTYEKHSETTWYFPKFIAWTRFDLRFYPVIGLRDNGIRSLGVRAVVKDPPKGDPGTLRAVIDGETFTSEIDPSRDLRKDTRGCRPTQIVFLRDQEELARRIAGARQVEISLAGYRRPRSHTLTAQDLDDFKRLVALFDLEPLPPAEEEPSPAAGRPGESFTPMEGLTDPRIIRSSKVMPRFPRAAMDRKVLGRVVLSAVVRKDGTVGDIEVVRSAGGDCGFEEAAIDAVRRWKYEPGLKDGEPVDVHFTIVIDFSFEGYRIAPG